MHDDEHQANPSTPQDTELSELREKVKRTVTVLNENRITVHRWFWKCLLAFNLVLASWVWWLEVLPRLLPL